MGRLQPVDIIGGFYADPDLDWSVQDTCNWLPVFAEENGTLSLAKLDTPPGLTLRSTAGTGDPCRLLYNAEGALFAVHGNKLRQFVGGAWVERGTIPGVGRVVAAHNGRQSGVEIRFDNGEYGGGYVFNMSTLTLTKITDEAFPGSVSSGYIDHYLTGVEPMGRYWFISDPDNAMVYNSLDRYDSEASPDRIRAAVPLQFEVVVFNATTTEFFYNAGGEVGSTFQNKRAVIDVGCAAAATVQQIDNTLMWLANDGIVYRINGYQKERISTVALEKALRGLNWSQAFGYTHVENGHVCYFLHFPDGQTWCYDASCKKWTRRESFGLPRWRVSHIVNWNGTWLAGDLFNGSVWELDWSPDGVREGSQLIRSYRRTQVAFNAGNPFHVEQVCVQVQCGAKPVDWPVDLDHELMLSYSKDGGHTWSNTKRRTLGAMGEYNTRVKYLNLGLMRQAVTVEIACSSPRKRDLYSASAEIAAA